MMLCAAIIIDFIPDAQTLLIVQHGVDSGMPGKFKNLRHADDTK